MRFFFGRSRYRRLPQFETVLWSLALSFALLLLSTSLWSLVRVTPTFVELLTTATIVPGYILVTLYVSAPVVGTLIGWADHERLLDRLLAPIGVELTNSSDVWTVVFRDRRWCYVHLNDGTVLYGWPELVSGDRQDSVAEIYLTGAMVRTEAGWEDLPRRDGVLLEAGNVRRIDFADTQ